MRAEPQAPGSTCVSVGCVPSKALIRAAKAGQMITDPALAIKFGPTIEHLTSTLHPYLTQSEGIKLAAHTFDRNVATLSCCAA